MIEELGMDPVDAWKKCNAVIIHGDLLAEKHLQDQNLDENDPDKGRYLLDWITKPEVVFARTTPS
jgi:sodium/potassium-transporting ATPase subunit alpha